MKIWIFNNYNMLPEQGGLNRHYYFGKSLKQKGHEPVVFVGSHPHNTNLQMISGKEAFRIEPSASFPWVYVRTCNYEGSMIKRIWSMLEYYRNTRKAVASFERPDAIVGSSAHPLAALLAVQLGRKFHCKSIVEIRDLWPESIIVEGIAKSYNPAVLLLRQLEHWLYKNADDIVFTMENAYDYIVERHWERDVPLSKVHYINNGVDLRAFDYNEKHNVLDDADLSDPNTFKVIYTGSLRVANGPQLIIDCAEKILAYPQIRFLIYGSCENIEELRQTCKVRGITNCIFKGAVQKKYIPYILSHSNLNLLNYPLYAMALYRYGSSQNKLFDYLASGKPILSNVSMKNDIITKYNCGCAEPLETSDAYAAAILHMYQLPKDEYEQMGVRGRQAAQDYDFSSLTQRLIEVIER